MKNTNLHKTDVDESVIVFKAKIARQLLKENYHLIDIIIDIKPAKENKIRSLFVFERTDAIMQRLKELTALQEGATK